MLQLLHTSQMSATNLRQIFRQNWNILNSQWVCVCTYLEAIKDKCVFIRAQFLVRHAGWSGPPYPHLPRGHHLKLKVPLPHAHTVGLLSTEDTKPLGWHVVHVCSGCWWVNENLYSNLDIWGWNNLGMTFNIPDYKDNVDQPLYSKLKRDQGLW